MPFVPRNLAQKYVARNIPQSLHSSTAISRELQEVSKAIDSLTKAIEEIQEFLKTLP